VLAALARSTLPAPHPNGAPSTVVTFLSILLSITSILMIVLVLLHKGKGGGLSTMFGGGVSSSLGGSAVVEKNLDRLTIICGLVWIVSIIALGLLLKETGPAVPAPL
jgi:preprotein translocase subunit SecG